MTNYVNENQSINGDVPLSMQEAYDEVSLLDLLQTFVDNLRLLVFGPLVVGGAALGVSFLIPPTYTAKTQFLPPQQQQSAAASMLASLGSLGGLAGAAAGIKNPADQFIAFMKSVTLQDALIARFKLQERYDVKTVFDARKELTENVRAVSGKDGIIALEVDDNDPQMAADLANAHIEELGKLIGKLALTEAQQRRLFFEKQLLQVKDKLTQSEIALKSTGISGGVLKSNPVAAVAAVAALQAQITAQEVKVGALRGYLSESAPDFKQAVNELDILRLQLSKQEISAPISNTNSVGGDYVNKYREFKYHESLFELFAKQYELAKVDEAREGAVIQVIDISRPPEKKSKPKKSMITIIATFSSFIALLIWIFFRQALVKAGESSESKRKILAIQTSLRKSLGIN